MSSRIFVTPCTSRRAAETNQQRCIQIPLMDPSGIFPRRVLTPGHHIAASEKNSPTP